MNSQVHFREPGLEHKEDIEHGTRSAIKGGVTSIFEMPNTSPLTLDEDTLSQKLEIARRTAWCDFAFFMGGNSENAHQLAELERLPGCAGVKIFMGSSTGLFLRRMTKLLLWFWPMARGVFPCMLKMKIGSYPDKE